jgi:hypothetical protein
MEITGIDLDKVKKKNPEGMKSVRMQIRTTPKISKWMKKHNISPSLVFERAVEALIEKENKKGKNWSKLWRQR